MMNFDEQAVTFPCNGNPLYGIVSVPRQASRRGVLVIVGGPQYRVGSHRQFALLARSLAAQGIPTMRFDYSGMGDSGGEGRTFEEVDDDVRAAVDHFIATVSGLEEVVIWGLCDAASAAMLYAQHDARVCALVLLNPWVRTTGGHAKATLKHYYRERLLQPELWKKVFSGRFEFGRALDSFRRVLAAARSHGKEVAPAKPSHAPAAASLPDRMRDGLSGFEGKVLLILSGRDLTAQEFSDVVKASKLWQRLLASARVTHKTLPAADHTFSRRVWRDQVATWTGDWIKSW